MKQRFVLLGVIAAFLMLVTISCSTRKPVPDAIHRGGSSLEKQGIMSQNDYVELREIKTTTKASGKISDADLDWAIQLLHKPSTHPEIKDMNVLTLFLMVKVISPPQENKIFTAATSVLADHAPTDTYQFRPQAAANVLGHLKDKRAVAYLRPLLASPNSDVRERAQAALRQLQV